MLIDVVGCLVALEGTARRLGADTQLALTAEAERPTRWDADSGGEVYQSQRLRRKSVVSALQARPTSRELPSLKGSFASLGESGATPLPVQAGLSMNFNATGTASFPPTLQASGQTQSSIPVRGVDPQPGLAEASRTRHSAARRRNRSIRGRRCQSVYND